MIPYGRQTIDETDIEAVVKVLRGNWLTGGPAVSEFETIVSKYVGVKHAIAVSNGTAALHLSCLSLGVKENDVGITSPFTFLASANAIAFCGGKPDFVDIDESTYCLSPDKLEKYIKSNGAPKVVIPVDFAGVPADLPAIWKLAKKYGFYVIEDAAHSIGSSYVFDNQKFHCGACVHSDIAILSFHPVKTVTAGEGGMVLTNNDKIARDVRMLASHGMQRDVTQFVLWDIDNKTGQLEKNDRVDCDEVKAPWLYQQQKLGYNYRITDIQCALGTSQFSRIDEIVKARRKIFDRYQQEFIGNESFILPPCPKYTDPAYHLYVIRYKGSDPQWRIKACSLLRQNDVFAQVHYIPVYLQPWYQSNFNYKKGKCPVSEEVYKTCLSIPLYPTMQDSEIKIVIDVLNSL